MLTVVDTINLTEDFNSTDFIGDRGESLGEEDERTLVDLLTDQIEFADIVVLNKVSDAGPERVQRARQIVKALNPDAKLIETDFGEVGTGDIFDTGLFDFDKAQEHPLWAKELYGFANHVPEDEEYGITSFVYHARAPFDPVKVREVLSQSLPGVIRAKGHFWIATRPDWAMEYSRAGIKTSISPLGRWWASVPESHLPDHPDIQAEIAANWAEPWGDRRQEIVFIGTDLDREAICAKLNAALVDAWDFTPKAWAGMADPFPPFVTRQVA